MSAARKARTRGRPTGRGAVSWPLVAVVVVSVAVAGGLLVSAAVAPDRDADIALTSPTAETGVSHVHGLGINPADGELYAATHHGVFRIPGEGDGEGSAALVSAPRDTMGFTVVGPDRFLGSGHPAFRGDPLYDEDETPLLGLIESADAGETWEVRSLFGEVDFHSLEAAHDLVYGFDSTSSRFLVSSDGEEWETRSDGLAMSDFAVDPASPEHVVAMTDAGLAESTDGGRSFEPIEGPALLYLSWHPELGLWGVDEKGGVARRDGPSWRARGELPGPPQALLVADDAVYAAASKGDRTGIYVSSDEGRSWQLRYADQ